MISRTARRMKITRSTFSIVIIFLFLATMKLSLASKQCKSTVMKVVMKQCSDAIMRSRRQVLRHVLPHIDSYNDVWIPEDNLEPKRQPIIIRDDLELRTIHGSMSHHRLLLSTLGRSRRAAQMNYPKTLPKVLSDDFGFELIDDQIDEMYNETLERFMRNSHRTLDETKQLFLRIAAKCCQDEESCMSQRIMSCV